MKIFKGKVISKKMDKTATVAVEAVTSHKKYKKRLKRIKKYHVHDGLGVNVGDRVRFVATKPISKSKKWEITKIVNSKRKEKKQ